MKLNLLMRIIFAPSQRLIALVCLFIIIFGIKANSQSNPTVKPRWEWGKIFNGSVDKIEYLNNYVYTAGTYSNYNIQIDSFIGVKKGGRDIFIAKWDTLGNLIWLNTIADTADQLLVAFKIANNKLYVGGNFTDASLQIGNTTFSTFGNQDGFTAQYDTNGIFLDANQYGSNFADTLQDMCIDYLGNEYLVLNNKLTKYSISGSPIWQKSPTGKIKNVFYSAIDTTILFTGSFVDSINIGTYTVYSIPVFFPGFINKIFCGKIELNACCVWLINVTNSNSSVNLHEVLGIVTMNPLTSKLYLTAECDFILGSVHEVATFEINPDSTFSMITAMTGIAALIPYPSVKALSCVDSELAMVYERGSYLSGIYWININTGTISHSDSFGYSNKGFLIAPGHAIYIGGYNGYVSRTFGKLAHDLLDVSASQPIITSCTSGASYQIHGVINTGTPPYTFSWLPTTGLSSVNTDTTQFTLNSTINYTLTVIDATGQVDSTIFAVRLDTPMTSPSITSSFSSFCGNVDTITLYSNVGSPVYWQEYCSSCSSSWLYMTFADSIVITNPNIYRYALYNACGSIMDNITINNGNQSSYVFITVNCNTSLPYIWNGLSLTNAGTYTNSYISATGCDSFSSIIFSLANSPTSTQNVTACLSYTWPITGLTYTQAGNYADTFQNISGCDSIKILHLQLLHTSTEKNVNACNSYTWPTNGINYSSSGIYSASLINSFGCDSIVNLHLSINSSTYSSQVINTCDDYCWPLNGNIYSISGLYTVTFNNSEGCDSVITLQFSRLSNSSTQNMTTCNAYFWPVDGNIYTNSGSYAATLINSSGCDSVITMNLDILSSSSLIQSAIACDTYVWSVNGNIYTNSGTYTATLINSSGCDSVITMTLDILSSSSSIQSAIACDTYVWSVDGNIYTNSGTYVATLINSSGCDSVINLQLTTLLPFSNLSTTLNADTITVNGPGQFFAWLDCNTNMVIPGATSQSYIAGSNGSFAAIVTVGACSDTSACVVVSTLQTINIEQDQQFYLFPNPNNGIFSILARNKSEIRIFNMLGEQIICQKLLKGLNHINLQSFACGLYIAQINSNQYSSLLRIEKRE